MSSDNRIEIRDTPPPATPEILEEWIGRGKIYKNVPEPIASELCRRVSISADGIALIPDASLSVLDLLQHKLPPRSSSLNFVALHSCFSDLQANTPLAQLLDMQTPPQEVLRKLRDFAGQAMLDGKRSVCYWTRTDVRLSFSALGFWAALSEAITAKATWTAALSWLQKQVTLDPSLAALQLRVNTVLASTPWKGFVEGLGRHASATEMSMFLSRKHLTDVHVDTMLRLLAVRLQQEEPHLATFISLGTMSLADGLSKSAALISRPGPDVLPYPNAVPADVVEYGDRLAENEASVILGVAHSPPDHWAAYSVDRPNHVVNWGDSIGRQAPSGFIKGMKCWLGHHLSSQRFRYCTDLACATQTDSHSCGIISVNTLKHLLFGDAFWTEEHCEHLRIEEFLDIMEYSAKFRCTSDDDATSPSTEPIKQLPPNPSSPLRLPTPEKIPTSSPVAMNAVSFMDIDPPPALIGQSSPISSPAPSSPDPVPVPSRVKGTLDSFFTRKDTVKRTRAVLSEPDSDSNLTLSRPPAKKQQVCRSGTKPKKKQEPPKPLKSPTTRNSLTTGASSSAKSKRKLNDSVEAGTFIADPVKWEGYKAKLKAIDPHYEIYEDDPTKARHVRHSGCGEVMKQSTVYDTYLFRKHVEKCKGKGAAGNTSTLDIGMKLTFKPGVIPVKKPATEELWPCPGLQEVDDARITVYLQRTLVRSAGGESNIKLAEKMFNKSYTALDTEKQEAVCLKQQQTHRWALDHQNNRVYAIGVQPCLSDVKKINDIVRPCSNCRKLLSLRAFLTAINRKIPEDENRIFVPHCYQNSAIGLIYTKHQGLRDLFEENVQCSSTNDIFRRYARQVAEGKYDKNPVFMGLTEIPYSHVPPLILAMAPLGSKTTAAELAAMERDILRLLLQAADSFCIITLGSDGAVTERNARRELLTLTSAVDIHYRILHPEGNGHFITVTVHKVYGQALAIIQDSKHCQKTFRNNLFSGATLLLLGRYPIYYELVRAMALNFEDSPLYRRDVEKLDRQDDRAAARLFSADALEHAIEHTDNLGLIAYLFVFGEMVDAYQSRTIPHSERVKMVLRARFFKDLWKAFLRDAGYPERRYFISRDADDITDILINGLLALIYIHRDHLEQNLPLLPWLAGSESNEHAFGMMRSLIEDFTLLDAARMVPKLDVRLQAACRAKNKTSDFRKQASGYMHTYFDGDKIPMHLLSIFPSDEEIADIAVAAYEEASMLWSLLGYDPASDAPSSESATQTPLPADDIDQDELEGGEEQEQGEISEKQELQNALTQASTLPTLPTNSTDTILDECTFAAASLNMEEYERIDSLPDEDPAQLEELRAGLAHILNSIASPDQVTALINSVRHVDTVPAAPPPPQDVLDVVPASPVDDEPAEESPAGGIIDVSTDLSSLVRARRANQTREAAYGVRSKKHSSQQRDEEDDSRSKKESEHCLLARKIHETLRLEEDRGYTGLIRRTRWGKSAAGAGDKKAEDETETAETGNTANARLAAQTGATAITRKRRAAFAGISVLETIVTAKIDMISPIFKGSWGLIIVDDDLMLGQVLTMYEKGGGKAAKHGWVSTSSSIAAISYLPVQVWQRGRQRQFRATHGKCLSLGIPRFNHLPAAAFLCLLPTTSIRILPGKSNNVELLPGVFEEIYNKLSADKARLILAVRNLLKPSRRAPRDE
ncbi:hypothetical protein EWM64_g3442 [Hericium alpestre]|uniref:Ubiquitin-like protease family profile domain-containing protein n=1 Tax=Hericium alpestre TaxID=135208 RepID=A0A4Z0A1J3_9AGAM|nr:hypothetical protein EWM64_g3442 [Hericium alpestre]